MSNTSQSRGTKRKGNDGAEQATVKKAKKVNVTTQRCPYLPTVDRSVIDFDFEKICCETLAITNIYMCCVCGKYYQGRGMGTAAHVHSLQADHHVFINVRSGKFYCLPDNYEVIDPSLNNITRVLNPVYDKQLIKDLDTKDIQCRTLQGKQYKPGIVGLNNIKGNEYLNVALQSLCACTDLRNFFLLPENYKSVRSELVQQFGLLLRKMWNPANFKAQASPHELVQEIAVRSKKRFEIGAAADPLDFLTWFLNTLHRDFKGTKKRSSSIINKCFQGILSVHGKEHVGKRQRTQGKEYDKKMPFFFLNLDIPPAPLMKDEIEYNIIPQIPLYTLLNKYNGVKEHYVATAKEFRTYKITRLPKYLILSLKRFSKNMFFIEKNPTIANFPIKNLELKEYVDTTLYKGVTKYKLIANIMHHGAPGKKELTLNKEVRETYSVHVLHKSSGGFYNMQDLIVEPVFPQLVALSEAYIQIYERQIRTVKTEADPEKMMEGNGEGEGEGEATVKEEKK